MTIRTTTSTVEFAASFKLPGDEEILPAGVYRIDTDEEGFEAKERTVYRRVETRLRIETPGRTVHRRVDPEELTAALQRDREMSLPKVVAECAGPESEKNVPQVGSGRPEASASSSIFRTARSWFQLPKAGKWTQRP